MSEEAAILTDEKTLREAARREKTASRQYRDDLRVVMSTEIGRRFVWSILERTRLYQESMTGNSWTFYHEGIRHVGLSLLADLMSICPEEYLKAQAEHGRNNG